MNPAGPIGRMAMFTIGWLFCGSGIWSLVFGARLLIAWWRLMYPPAGPL
jgi:hypothetical protein